MMVPSGQTTRSLAPYNVQLEEVLEVICTAVAGSSVAEITRLKTTQADVAIAINQVSVRGSAIPYHDLSGPPRRSTEAIFESDSVAPRLGVGAIFNTSVASPLASSSKAMRAAG